MKRWGFWGLGIVLAGAVGCGPLMGGGSGPVPPAGPKTVQADVIGGVIWLDQYVSASGSTSEATAWLVKIATPDPTPYRLTIADSHCEVVPPLATGNFIPADAGPFVAFTSGAAHLISPWNGSEYDSGTHLGAIPGGTGWTVTASGGADISAGELANVRLPGTLTSVVAPAIDPGQPATITWNPTGADTAVIHLSGGSTDTECYPSDSGSFVVPADLTSALGAGVVASVFTMNEDVVTIGGRDVRVIGASFSN